MVKTKRKNWEEATRWFLWLRQKKAKAEEIDVFTRWKAQSSDNEVAFKEIETVWDMCDSINDLPWPLPEELANDHYDGNLPISLPELPASTVLSTTSHQLFGSHKRHKHTNPFVRQARKRFFAAAASVFILATTGLLGFNVYQANSVKTYETALAGHKTYQLDDGSSVTLGALTKISVLYTEQQRQIDLISGEAFFEVAKDKMRPFIVNTGQASVQAVGTAFNINKRTNSVVVSVIEGLVRLEENQKKIDSQSAGNVLEQDLMQGQQAIYENSGTVQLLSTSDLVRANSWRNGNLAYVSESLDKVIEDVNRYSKTKLVIGDKAVADLVFTGTVLNQDINDWLNGLVKTFPVRLLHLEDKIVLLTPLKT